MHFFSICLLVAAASAHPRYIRSRQQSGSPVELWGQPGDVSRGIANGCAKWSNSTTTPANLTTSSGSQTGGGSSTGGDDISTDSTPTDNGAGDTSIQSPAAAANLPVMNFAAQVPAVSPAKSPEASPAASSSTSAAGGGIPLSTGTAGSTTGSTAAGGSKLAKGVAKLGAAVVGGSSSGGSGTDSTTLKTQSGDGANPYKGAKASMGKCPNVQVPEGWDGVASSTYYGYMGTACNCGKAQFGQASWQANTGESLGIGQGVYSGAVNQALFKGALNSGGQPNCGAGCGLCYELMTTGVNAYAGGVGGGSTIQMMVVDACYGTADTAPHWCSSNTASGTDDFGCEKHFDIDTDPTLGNVPAVGQDGTTWTNGGQIVLYRLLPNCSSISPMLEEAFNTDCKPYCAK
ncbi:MAG: hypothetical protein OHK93_005417 [Ramalina farinacea]|uniref:Cellulase n=1 Tax=Ramalina farinacea TaxID=258253 RepID=A0AA43QJS1_9LECA|nr:hypothetical protein [Ramalina farinacea]